MSFAEAAAITLTGITAHITLVKKGNAKAGERVLINGGTSGVGVLAIQMAKAIGCHTVVTCSEQSFDTVKAFGADEVVDYKDGPLTDTLAQKYGASDKRFDLIFDVSSTRSVGLEVWSTDSSPRYRLSAFQPVRLSTPAPAGIWLTKVPQTQVYNHCAKYIKPTGRYLNISLPSDSMYSAISVCQRAGPCLISCHIDTNLFLCDPVRSAHPLRQASADFPWRATRATAAHYEQPGGRSRFTQTDHAMDG